MTDLERAFLIKAEAAAIKVDHPFPKMAACEAALESNYGRSGLAIEDNNLFGMKWHRHSLFGSAILPTREFIHGAWVEVVASWVKYSDWSMCFADRVAALHRLASVFPHYAAALKAPDAQTYISEVSKTWSTDPNRAKKVLVIYELWHAEQDLARSEGAD